MRLTHTYIVDIVDVCTQLRLTSVALLHILEFKLPHTYRTHTLYIHPLTKDTHTHTHTVNAHRQNKVCYGGLSH